MRGYQSKEKEKYMLIILGEENISDDRSLPSPEEKPIKTDLEKILEKHLVFDTTYLTSYSSRIISYIATPLSRVLGSIKPVYIVDKKIAKLGEGEEGELKKHIRNNGFIRPGKTLVYFYESLEDFEKAHIK